MGLPQDERPMQLRLLSRQLEVSSPSPERDELLGRARRRMVEIEAWEERGPPSCRPALADGGPELRPAESATRAGGLECLLSDFDPEHSPTALVFVLESEPVEMWRLSPRMPGISPWRGSFP